MPPSLKQRPFSCMGGLSWSSMASCISETYSDCFGLQIARVSSVIDPLVPRIMLSAGTSVRWYSILKDASIRLAKSVEFAPMITQSGYFEEMRPRPALALQLQVPLAGAIVRLSHLSKVTFLARISGWSVWRCAEPSWPRCLANTPMSIVESSTVSAELLLMALLPNAHPQHLHSHSPNASTGFRMPVGVVCFSFSFLDAADVAGNSSSSRCSTRRHGTSQATARLFEAAAPSDQ